jgi:hypothetical protein
MSYLRGKRYFSGVNGYSTENQTGLEMSAQHWFENKELSQKLDEILDKHSALFSTETGYVKGIKANLIMKESAKPVCLFFGFFCFFGVFFGKSKVACLPSKTKGGKKCRAP